MLGRSRGRCGLRRAASIGKDQKAEEPRESSHQSVPPQGTGPEQARPDAVIIATPRRVFIEPLGRLGAVASAERTFSLLTQVAGRAGRGELLGEVVVQTFTPHSPSITVLKRTARIIR